MSYRQRSQLDATLLYESSVNLKLYTLAYPILSPPTFSLLYNSIFSPCFGVPDVLLTLRILPISKGIFAVDIVSVSLGFSISRIVVEILSTSYPLT